jgi:hypothetical protein
MSILSQAETIRDATLPSENTANRVGTCLVDIANAIGKYCCAIGDSQEVTPIATAGEFVKIVTDIGYVATDGSFEVSDSGILTAVTAGTYDVTVVMSMAIETGTHNVSASIGTSAAADLLWVVDTTLTNGINNPHQVVLKFAVGLAVGDTLAVWVTDNDHDHDILVSRVSINAVRLGPL